MEIFFYGLAVILLIATSAACSGLNLALMSLDVKDLERKAKSGNKKAKRVLPFRKNSNLALASILIGNVGVISATSLVLEKRISGLFAGLLSTLLIVIFGELLPQAVLMRHALRATNFLLPFLRLMMLVTYPLAKPLQLVLDGLLKEQRYELHTRNELGLIINEHLGHSASELDESEVGIIQGALTLSDKKVKDIMTPIKKVYHLSLDTIIDGEKIDEIKSENWSRIPVFNSDLTVCDGVLLMKDLIDLDFDNEPKKVSELHLYTTSTVGSMTALDTMMNKFIIAHTHLIPVERDDKIIGVVSIEDLVEEIIGREIEDESDQ